MTGVDNFSTGFQQNIDDAIKEARKFNSEIKFNFIKCDIRKYSDCRQITKNIDVVLHQAAIGSVQRSIDKPLLTNDVNIKGTLNLLKASVENNVKRFIFASSSSIYGDSDILPKVEDMSPNPKSVYAVSKLASEYYVKLFYKIYGLETISLRYFNVFGKRQNPNSIYSSVIPRFICSLIRKKPAIIFGDGMQSRDFTYIDNVVDANFKAIFAGDYALGQCFNIACGRNINLNELYKLIAQNVGFYVEPVYKEKRKGDVIHSLAEIKKAEKILGYKTIYEVEEGLKLTIEWFKDRTVCL